MTDLQILLHEAAGPPTAAPDHQFTEALLARGQRALRRRRAALLSAGSALAATVLTAVVALSVSRAWARPNSLPTPAGSPLSFTLPELNGPKVQVNGRPGVVFDYHPRT